MLREQSSLKNQVKIFTSMIIVGLLNVTLLALCVFYLTKNTLIHRAENQMIALCSQSRDRLSLFLSSTNEHFKKSNLAIQPQVLEKLLSNREGLGKTGEAYLVGEDGLIKTSSRFGPTWNEEKIVNTAVKQGLLGKEGTTLTKDYRKIEVISAYMPFTFGNQRFVLLCEIDYEEVISPLYSIQSKVFLIGIFLTFISGIVALFSTRFLIKSISNRDLVISRLESEKSQILKEEAQKIFKIIEEDRHQIAQDAHDGLGQILTAIKWKNKDAEIKDLCDLAMQELSQFTKISPTHEHLGLREAIVTLVKLCQNEEMKIDLEVSDNLSNQNLHSEIGINFFRIVQETIQNAMKHSKATHVKISILFSGTFILTYSDNGIGIPPSSWPPRSLNYRIDVFNGKMESISFSPLQFRIYFPGEMER